MSWLQASRSLCMPFGPGLSFKPQASVLVSVLSRLPYLCALLSTYDSLTSVNYFILTTSLLLYITFHTSVHYFSFAAFTSVYYFPLTTPLLLFISFHLRLHYFYALLTTLDSLTSVKYFHKQLPCLCALCTFHLIQI